MPISLRTVFLAFTILLVIGGLSNATGAAETPAEMFKAVHERYLALDKRLKELATLYGDQSSPSRDTIYKEYTRTVEKANALLGDLRTAALEAYTAEPNKDKAVTQVLLGLANHDLHHDEYTSAAKLTKLLLDNECTEKAVYDLAGQAAYSLDEYDQAEMLFGKAKEAKALSFEGKMCFDDFPAAKERWAAETELRKKEAQADDLPRVKLETTKGPITIELLENEAPQTVANFVSLVTKGFYDNTPFHRVLPGFMAQGGDPTGTGTGGPGYKIYCECGEPNHRNHFSGTLSMAHSGKDTGGSQFFLTFRRAPHLDGKHTVFGRVIEGADVLTKVQRRDPQRQKQIEPDKIVKATVVRKRQHEYEPTKVPPPADDKKPKPGEDKKPKPEDDKKPKPDDEKKPKPEDDKKPKPDEDKKPADEDKKSQTPEGEK